MTAAEHQAQVAAVRASLLMGESRAERHGVYARRAPHPVGCPVCSGTGRNPISPTVRCSVCHGRPGVTG